jgi:hypothetical protein
MNTRGASNVRVPLWLAAACASAALLVGPAFMTPARGDSLARPEGQALAGKLVGDARSGAVFQPQGSGQAIPLEAGAVVSFDGSGPGPSAAVPPFRLDLGLGQRLSGRLGAVGDATVRLDDGPGGPSVTLARPGVLAVVQRPGEAQVLHDDFESLDASRWSEVGEPEVVKDVRALGEHSLRLPAGGASVTCRLPEPVGSGRLEAAFHDTGVVAPGQQWFVDLLFRGPAGPEPVRAVLGWAEETLGVESPSGPALAVQRLPRKQGWHRLSVRFGPDQTEIAVDGNELAHGKGPEGPLIEIRVATYSTGKTSPPPRLAGYVDDLRLAALAEPVGGLEVDPTQDEVRLVQGDQVFGTVRSADADRVILRVLGKDVALPWSEVAGLYFRRAAVPARPIGGLLVRLEWRSAPGNDPGDIDQVEGALTSVSDKSVSLVTPYAGVLTIPRDRLRRLRVVGRGRRLVLDPTAHHLGNEITAKEPMLDPPQPEGGVLERSITLESVPEGPAAVVLDVVQVVGESSTADFADEVRRGGLRTILKVNGKTVDYLNRHITSRNETPERIRLAIPAGVLKAGVNRLRIEQQGRANDPKELDDLGVLCVALEFGAARAGGPSPERP